ncbi:hybrid sensor histidine kinase/response regulator [Ramlibacter sp.]|uniref:hybrid sensor histidine kinase/response regulator n=1 Tax=Ramlibacter sp. TaxID=1917967 RepID=UPI002BD2AA45|nr:ATP-binding protein [Ramlibacter sp.]HWI82255.1 ATP-binding protein [Ramlibacter sp.]
MFSHEALAEHVEHLQRVLEGATLGTFDYDLASSQVQVSPLTCRIYGLPPAPAVPVQQLLAHIDEAGRESRQAAYVAALDPQGEGVYQTEYRLTGPGAPRWVSVRGRVVFGTGAPGARVPRRLVGVVSDITPQKTQQEALEQFTAMTTAIGNSTDAFMYVKDRESRMLFCNGAVLRALGKRSDQVLGKTDREFAGPGPATDAIMEHDRQVMAQGTAQVYHESIESLNRVYYSTKTPVRNARGEVIGLAGVSVDVTELHEARRALQESEERAAMAAEAAEIGVYDWDVAGDRLVWSQALREQFGIDMAEVVTLDTAVRRIHPEDQPRLKEALRQAMDPASDGRLSIEYRTVPVAGETRWLHVLGKAEFRGTGAQRTARRVAGVSINITKRKALEQALRDADRRKDEFLAMLAHELRNPLAPVLNATAALERGDVPAGQIARIARIANRQTRHMARLIDDLLDASRLTLGKISIRRAPLRFGDIVTAAAEHAIAPDLRARRRVRVDVQPEAIWVDGDNVRLMQLVSNLLNNAAKFTADGGAIRVQLAREGDEAVLTVEDDGQGIGPDLLPRIFELFVQGDSSLDRASGGLGIGLSLVKALAQLHGGSVQAESDGPGRGARFRVRLPVGAAPLPPQPAPRPTAASARRILIIEDNIDAAETLKLMLELQGHEVATAGDGPAGLQAARDSAADTMLIDIGLPGMTGFEVAQRMRSQLAGQPARLIALTGYGSPEDKRRVLEAGFDLHLVKPVSLEDLTLALDSSTAAA